MAQVLIRQLDDDTVVRLKAQARRNGRSLESELREILREAVANPREELDAIRKAFAGRRLSDSSELLRGR